MTIPKAAELTGSNPEHPETQAATIARLERELAEAHANIGRIAIRALEYKADAEALRALAGFTNTGPICGRRVVICESYTRDRPFWRVELYTSKRKWNAEHSDLAAAIMDALGKAAK